MALFLASDLSGFVTGHNIPVDGGHPGRRRLVLLPDRRPVRQPADDAVTVDSRRRIGPGATVRAVGLGRPTAVAPLHHHRHPEGLGDGRRR